MLAAGDDSFSNIFFYVVATNTLMPQLGNLVVVKVAKLALLPAKLASFFSSLKKLSTWPFF
jgi:hypothetical protein